MEKFDHKPDCDVCAQICSIFKFLTTAELVLMNKNRFEVQFKAGEIIAKQGTAMTHAIAFIDGLAKIYLEGYNYKNLIIKIQEPGEIIASPGMYVENRHLFSICALTNCKTCFIDLAIFKQIIHENSIFTEAFIANFAQRTNSYYKKLISLTQKQSLGRLAEVLLYLSENIFKSEEFDMIVSRQDLADMTAMTKESVIRSLKTFQDDNLISLKGNNLKILNANTLNNISRTG